MRQSGRGDLVLLVGPYRPAVGAARALARRGRRVVVGRGPDTENVEGSGGVEHSRHVERVWRHPPFREDPRAFIAALVREVESIAETVYVFPFYEPVLDLLSRSRHRLPENARLVTPSADAVEICLDKERALEAAAAAGLPSLPFATVKSHEELVDWASRMPLVVRPMPPEPRLGGQKAILARSTAELVRQMPSWPEPHDRLLVQRLAEGPRINLHFAAREGRLLGSVEAVATRTDTPDGTGLGVEGHTRPPSPALTLQLTQFVDHVHYTGVGLAQFVVEAGGTDGFFIELNPRIGAHHILADRAGLDLANLAVDIAGGQAIAPLALTGPGKIRLAWTLGDLIGLLRATASGSIDRRGQFAWFRRLVVSALRADVHATWSWRDPMPAAVTWWRYLTGRSRRAARTFRRSAVEG